MKSEFNCWYLDDGTLGGDVDTVLKDAKEIMKAANTHGLQVNPSKSELFLINPKSDICKCVHSCESCGKSFSQKGNLKKHIHTVLEDHEDYKCDSCCKSFSQEEDLKEHIHRIHVGLRVHKCDLCNKVFSQEGNLKVHIHNVHEGQEVYKCDSCGELFSCDENLKNHIHSIHNDHKCDSCDKSFSHSHRFDSITQGIKIVNSFELTLLGAPIFPEGIEAVLDPKLSNLQTMSQRLQEIENHEALFLLRHCFGMPKLTYFLRTSPCFMKS